jgi:hypothetical protein
MVSRGEQTVRQSAPRAVKSYAEIDLTLKANAVALCEVRQQRPGRSWKEDKDLMAFLKSL